MTDANEVHLMDSAGAPRLTHRVAQILRAVAATGMHGARLLDLATETGIARPTVHRLLRELAQVGFVEQRADRRYGIGPALFTIGLAAPAPIRDLAGIEAVARELAADCGDTVYLGLRCSAGVHYLLRLDGSYPVRVQTIGVGETRPFSSSYSGIALLATMDPGTREETIAREFARPGHAASLPGTVASADAVRAKVAETERLGFCTGAGIVMPGVDGLAVAIPSSSGSPYLTLSISAVDRRLSPERILGLLRELRAAAQQMGELAEPQ